jgi:DNA-binding transcriptional LysR family regulator
MLEDFVDVRQLTTFRLLAQTLSFTRAAAALNYAQSNVSAQIHALEEELGVRLFDRLGRRVALTEPGRRLLAYTDQILDLVDEARDALAAAEELEETLLVSAPESICAYRLPLALRALRARHPHVRVVFRPSPVAELRRRVNGGELDVAFLLEESFSSSTLAAHTLSREPVHLVVAPEHPLAERATVAPADLRGHHLLLTERGCSYRARFERRLSEADVYPASILEFASIEAIKQCVMLGMGVAVLPHMTVTAELADDRLVALPWSDGDFHTLMQLVHHKEKGQSRAVQAMVAVAGAVLGKPGTLSGAGN